MIEVSGESRPVQRPDKSLALHLAQNGFQDPALGGAVQVTDAFIDDEKVGPLDQAASHVDLLPLPGRQPRSGDADRICQARHHHGIAQ